MSARQTPVVRVTLSVSSCLIDFFQRAGGHRAHSIFVHLLCSGFIKNTEKLSYGKERMYKLTVTAYDCGKNRASEDVLVKISVKPTCKPSWQGIKAFVIHTPFLPFLF